MSDRAFYSWLRRRGWVLGELTERQKATLRAEYDRGRNTLLRAVPAQRPESARGESIPMILAAGEQAEGPLEIVSEPGGITIEAAAGKDGAAATLPKFSMIAYTGGPMRLGGWRYPVVVDLAGLSIPSQQRPIRFGHNPDSGVGHTEAIAITDGKLTASGVISRDTPHARDVVSSSKNGFPWQASIGASVDSFEFVHEDKTAIVNGREFPGPLNVVRKSTLGEISFVDIGADGNTSARVAAAANQQESIMTPFEKWLVAQEFDAKTITAKQRTTLEAAFNAEQDAKTPALEVKASRSADQIIEEAKARREREKQITAIIEEYVSKPGADIEAYAALAEKAFKDNMPVLEVRVEAIRLDRPPSRIGLGGRSVDTRPTQGTLEAAALMSVGHSGESLVKSHGLQTVEQADKKFGHNMGLQELVLSCARANGFTGRDRITAGNWRQILNWATPDRQTVQATGFSTVDLTGILGNVANKAFAVVGAEPNWLTPRLAGVANHTNFHSHTIYSLALNGDLAQVGPTGELKHLAFAEESYTRQVLTRGAILRISRTDIINDDLGVFNRNAAGLARKSFNAREKALLTAIMVTGAGSTHFTAARGNYVSGGTTVFGNTGMSLALKAFRGLVGPDNDPIMVEPALLLVPPTLEAAARALLAAGSLQIVTGMITDAATGTLASSANIWAGRFGGAPLVSPFLETTTITGNSAAYYYLLADPAIYPCFEIAYLNGNQTPTVEYFGLDSEADTLGMTWRVYYDFGVGAAEWRAGVKVAGA
ncbi:MAG: hypothetical protein IMZ55_09320 [Acidobacteria bacterium]|nr:hypothetical protein [Acidobacteriota bacterium]